MTSYYIGHNLHIIFLGVPEASKPHENLETVNGM